MLALPGRCPSHQRIERPIPHNEKAGVSSGIAKSYSRTRHSAKNSVQFNIIETPRLFLFFAEIIDYKRQNAV